MRSSPKGVVLLKCKAEKATATLQFYVSDQSDMPILGRAACEQLQLVKRIEPLAKTSVSTKEELINMYPSVFTGLGEFPRVHHIYVDPTVTPVIHGCRNIPLAVRDKLKETLQDLVRRSVISPVTEPTEWVNSLVITEKKNGSLRVCLDPRDLNKAIKRQHYSIPTPDEVCSNLAGKSIFTILDEKDGYWQIKLDEPSSKLCTFNSPWGRCRFRRLPFGIRSASEVFQQKNCETFGDIQGVHIIADDMIIAASSEQEHDEILDKVMERAKAAKVRFNGEKIQFKVKTVKYMGHIITPEGLRPDEAKVKAITDMPPPEDKQALQRLLGMTKYLAQYIPKEASLTAPLRQLLRKDAVWQWNPHHSTALENLKSALTKAPVLRFYDHKKPLTIQADSSKDGLGACLLQAGHPVCYASRALTDTEQRYAQIEKELLAILFAARKFHQYIYGRTVMVQSDHKPLENIMQKQLCKAPARLQRMLLQLQKYELNIAYTPGKHMHIADMLSHATVGSEADDSGDLYEVLNIPDKSAHTVIQKMKSVFARHGIPKELVSDNVPFASYEMQAFAASWDVKLTFSSPGYPQSNGLAERAIKTVKHALKKALQTGTDPHLVLLSLRNTPVTGLNESPAQMLMGRVLRSTIPCSSAVLQQSTPQHIHKRLVDLQSRMRRQYNRNAKTLPELAPGLTVHMQSRRGWVPAVVVQRRDEPRLYGANACRKDIQEKQTTLEKNTSQSVQRR
ncbi:Retrovirus-related Pol polyprotein from transposon 297 [Labeo rohita]|uniref:ribonuclease H n=1 Tax=Labeo rohita TaxID=84645 RepID=A0A498MFI6_LABRO|nr:Retrovirus-related Pol polyprotein from transposon 297 [Labeo rohita]